MNSISCGNCGSPLAGPYCGQCGQHSHASARSLGALLHDAWDVISHVDGRFWTTVWMLLAHPGQLTLDYFADRRARYVLPLRLYLALSIAFFALAAVNAARAPAAADISLDPTACTRIELHWPFLRQRLRAACEREVADNGRSAAHAFGSYIPKMMFAFLPLIALVMLLLYRRPQRYYVEHLVFFLHIHAALFLVMSADVLWTLAARALPWSAPLASAGDLAAACYALWCVYRALRRYYEQSRGVTLIKLAVVGVAYQGCLTLLIAATLLLSALTT
ncbi:MAG TPA: DUF3667 domain-containing protein [Steroidobacteraceae bacterium]